MILIELVQRLNLMRVKKNSYKNVSSRRKIALHIIIFRFFLFNLMILKELVQRLNSMSVKKKFSQKC